MYHQQILLPQSLQCCICRLCRLTGTKEVLVGQQEALGIHLVVRFRRFGTRAEVEGFLIIGIHIYIVSVYVSKAIEIYLLALNLNMYIYIHI